MSVATASDQAVLDIRRQANEARWRLRLPQKSYAGVPTKHERFCEHGARCDACAGAVMSL